MELLFTFACSPKYYDIPTTSSFFLRRSGSKLLLQIYCIVKSISEMAYSFSNNYITAITMVQQRVYMRASISRAVNKNNLTNLSVLPIVRFGSCLFQDPIMSSYPSSYMPSQNAWFQLQTSYVFFNSNVSHRSSVMHGLACIICIGKV